MFVRYFFTIITIIVIGFFAFLWTPLEMPFRTTFIVGVITFSATAIHELIKYVGSYEKTKIRGF